MVAGCKSQMNHLIFCIILLVVVIKKLIAVRQSAIRRIAQPECIAVITVMNTRAKLLVL